MQQAASREQWPISGEYPYISAQQRNACIKSHISAIDPSFHLLFVIAIVLPNIIVSWLAQLGNGDFRIRKSANADLWIQHGS